MSLASSPPRSDSSHLSHFVRLIPLARLLIACAGWLCVAPPLASAQILASRDDAYVSRNESTREWAIGNRGFELIIGFNARGTLSLKRLSRPEDGHIPLIRAEVEPSVTLDDREVPLEEAGSHTALAGATPEETETGVRLSLTFEDRVSHALVTRAYAIYPGSPTLEAWTVVEAPSAGSLIRVSQMIGWQLSMPNAPLKWVSGQRSWLPPDGSEQPFTIEGGGIDDGAHVEIGSSRRSSEAYVPLLVVESDEDTFYGGVIWSGAWRIASDRYGDSLTVQADFPAATASASPGRPVELPHAFFGVTDTSAGAASRALRQFVLTGIRKGNPFLPLVTYNTWFPHGARIDESTVAEEISRASGVGVELFVLDAGWYENAGADHQYDFTTGLGSWKVDRARFPNGLGVLADLARDLGMKFGIWVEPERVALAAAGQPGLAQEAWLATQNGSYGDGQSGQICLASDAGRRWVFDRIVELLDDLKPDYLKWDNNFWINCNRGDHEHGSDDGNYAHVVALYGLLGELRRRYPNLLIENVSGGGNRMDYGMLAYSDVGWMDDRTAPSAHVRHNLEGLLLAFPPAYLFSFVIGSEAEPLSGDDFFHVARSRMPGVLGVTYHYQELDADLSRNMRLGIAQYKEIRDTIAQSSALLLSDQAHADGEWDVIEEIADDQRSAILFAFKASDGEGRLLVKPKGLNPQAIYRLRSLDAGNLESLSGEQLMRDGFEFVQLDGSRAHVLILTATNF